MMRSALLLVLVAGVSAGAPLKPKAPPESSPALDGKWVVHEATFGGIEQPHFTGLVFLIHGDQYAAHTKPASDGRIVADDKARPRRLEFQAQSIDGKPVTNWKKGRWIYELDGDELRMSSFPDSDDTLPVKIDPKDPKQLIWKTRRVKD